MAFKASYLFVSNYAFTHTTWVYVEPPGLQEASDSLADKLQPGYFDEACDYLTVNNTIIITASDGQAMRWVQKSDQDGVVLGKMS